MANRRFPKFPNQLNKGNQLQKQTPTRVPTEKRQTPDWVCLFLSVPVFWQVPFFCAGAWFSGKSFEEGLIQPGVGKTWKNVCLPWETRGEFRLEGQQDTRPPREAEGRGQIRPPLPAPRTLPPLPSDAPKEALSDSSKGEKSRAVILVGFTWSFRRPLFLFFSGFKEDMNHYWTLSFFLTSRKCKWHSRMALHSGRPTQSSMTN